jgi:hypothetical protein
MLAQARQNRDMTSANPLPEQDRGLCASNDAFLDQRFYNARPWAYFRRRLAHLALTADPTAGAALAGGTTFTIGPVEIRLDPSEDDDADISSIGSTRFVAIEAEMLLHHVSETLLRLALAHLPDTGGAKPPSPWLAIARQRSPKEFKKLIRRRFQNPDAKAVRQDMRVLFGVHPEDAVVADDRLDECARYLSYFASIFLDSDAYNAAKHGFALRGERSQLNVRVDDLEVVDVSGYSLDLLHVVTDGGRKRWRVTTRWFSLEGSIALTWTATALLENLWTVGCQRRLGAPKVRVFSPPPLSTVLDLGEGDPRRLVEIKRDLAYDDEGIG